MPELCEQWRTRQVEESVLSDVYDGEVWKNFKWKDGSRFFELERRYGLMLNVDWFQPFKRRSDYSVGVIYFVVMNLPRSQRFKFENVILGGIIPSLESEPKLHTFLDPCVDELNELWKGVPMSTSLTPVSLGIVAALLCVASDIPTSRKVCGTAKYVFKLWADNIFSKKQLKEITQKIDELNTATSIGRIPRKIGTNYGNYTAEE